MMPLGNQLAKGLGKIRWFPDGEPAVPDETIQAETGAAGPERDGMEFSNGGRIVYNLKVYVYAICKNEEQHIAPWVESMREADGIYVLDTGSDDSSVALLSGMNVVVKSEKISPWRFDVARNRSLAMVPEDADLCVCTDMDEIFLPGWREKMEEAWLAGAHRLKYRYVWSFNKDGSEGCVFWISKAHARKGFVWTHPVHEVLEWKRSEPCIEREASGVQLEHYPDPTKSRGQYLPLLELSVLEKPDDDRNMHYLGREYMFHGMWEKCEETLLRHLALPNATWPDERSASMRFLARAVEHQGRPLEEAFLWLLKAAAEAPSMREPWIELSEFEQKQENWAGSLFFAEKALAIQHRSRSYINEAASWAEKPYDLAAIAAYYLKDYDKAKAYGRKALEYDPENARLQKNMEFYQAKGD